MFTKLKSLNRRTLCSIGAGIVALSLIIGGAFAWADNSQHKSNIVTGGAKNTRQDVVLVEDFEQPPDWQEGDELKKEVWVKNTGDGQLYIRLNLKEYMEIAKETYTYSKERLLVDVDGKFMYWSDKTSAENWLKANKIPYKPAQLVEYTAYGETEKRVYFATAENTPLNGRDGKFMLTEYKMDPYKSLMKNVVKGSYSDTDDHQLHPTDECRYTPHLWSSPDLHNCHQGDNGLGTFHDYVEWNLGDSVILLSQWGGEPVAKWILDDVSDDKDKGYAYWGEALNPGAKTDMLLESILLKKQPEGPFYYALHVDMQAVTLDQLTQKFDDIPPEVEDCYRMKTGFHITAESFTATQGSTVQFTATWNGADVTSQIPWTSIIPVKGTAPSVGPQTRFQLTPQGLLKIGPQQQFGSVIIKAGYNPGNGLRESTYVITVKEPATP